MAVQDMFATLAALHRRNSGKNYIGQCIQNTGGRFSILGTDKETGKPAVIEYNGVNWDSKTGMKKKLDNDAEKVGQSITWPGLFERLGNSESETDLGRLYIGYAVRMLVGKLAIQNILNAEALESAFVDDKGFSPKLWDKWAKDNNYTCHVVNKQGVTVTEYIPSGKLIAHLIEVAKELNKLANYHSLDSVKDRESGGFDVSAFKL